MSLSLKMITAAILGSAILISIFAFDFGYKPITKKITILYRKPATTGDAPTLRIQFMNATNPTNNYTFTGYIQLMQVENERSDGSVFSIRNLQHDLSCVFNMQLPEGHTELIINSVGVTGEGWFLKVNNGPEIPLVNSVAEQRFK